MLISARKKKENIAEYLLYMWQIEDIIRANNLDADSINKNIISKYDIGKDVKKEMREWYESLIEMMRLENVTSTGHLQINKNVLIRLTELHSELMKSTKYPDYVAEFYKTLPYIVELRGKAGENKSGELETCFNALYGTLMLRLQGKELSQETMGAITQISRFIAKLAAYYKKNEESPLFED